MQKNDKDEFYFLKYDYLSLREEMRENLKYQKELGWTCIAAVLAYFGLVLSVKHVIPELCLVPLPFLLFCSAKVQELKRSNIRIIKYIDKKTDELKEWVNGEKSDNPEKKERVKGEESDNPENSHEEETEDYPVEIELWEKYLIKKRKEESDEECKRVSVLATSEYALMGAMCLLIYVMKSMENFGKITFLIGWRGCVFIIGLVLVVFIIRISWQYWRITSEDIKKK